LGRIDTACSTWPQLVHLEQVKPPTATSKTGSKKIFYLAVECELISPVKNRVPLTLQTHIVHVFASLFEGGNHLFGLFGFDANILSPMNNEQLGCQHSRC
jgi:hypothetical protein